MKLYSTDVQRDSAERWQRYSLVTDTRAHTRVEAGMILNLSQTLGPKNLSPFFLNIQNIFLNIFQNIFLNIQTFRASSWYFWSIAYFVYSQDLQTDLH